MTGSHDGSVMKLREELEIGNAAVLAIADLVLSYGSFGRTFRAYLFSLIMCWSDGQHRYPVSFI